MKNSFIVVCLVLLSACATGQRITDCVETNPEGCALYDQVGAVNRHQEEMEATRIQQ